MENAMTRDQAEELLTTLGFDPTHADVEKECFNDLWTLVKGEQYGGITGSNLRAVMMNVIGIPTNEKEGSDPQAQEED
jgi:hypothetical protein